MEDIQTAIWYMVMDAARKGNSMSLCKSAHLEETKRIYEEMGKRFETTLSEDQQKILFDLTMLADSIRQDSEEISVVAGLLLAKELQVFIHRPEDAYQAAVRFYDSPQEIHGLDGWVSYFERQKAEEAKTI